LVLLAKQVVVANTNDIILLILGALIIFAQSFAIAPFIYTLF
jgi:hypothetical protein